jgi:hypothetical protein
MLRIHDGNEALLQSHQGLEIRQVGRAKDQQQIDVVRGKRCHCLLVVQHLDLEAHRTEAFAERGHFTRQELERQRLAAGDAHGAAPQPLEVLDLRLHAFHVAVVLAQEIDEHLAGRGEPHTTRAPLEQRRTELFLQVEHVTVHRRGGDVELLGRLADRSTTRHLVHIVENA